jgi:hypothetical protein
MVIDTAVILTPFVVVTAYPLGIFEFLKDNHRVNRRRFFDEVDLVKDENVMSDIEVVKYYRSLGFEDPV